MYLRFHCCNKETAGKEQINDLVQDCSTFEKWISDEYIRLLYLQCDSNDLVQNRGQGYKEKSKLP